MNPIGTTGTGGSVATPLRVFLSHTSDLGKHTEPGSFVAAAVEAVLRARHAVTDMAYFATRELGVRFLDTAGISRHTDGELKSDYRNGGQRPSGAT